MIIMPSNNVGPKPREYMEKYPDKVAQLFSPDGWSKPRHKYALDNGCFKQFQEDKYFKMLEDSKKYETPMFIVVPDVVGCHSRTVALWHYYKLRILGYGPLAFVAQDGCTPDKVPLWAEWIFIGGLDPWKMDNVHKFIGNRPVHVGRVNSLSRLRYCEQIGVTSVDGTGWMRDRSAKKYVDFCEWFEGNPQGELF